MPDNVTPVTLIPGTLPYADDCYPSPQTLNVDIVTRIQAFISSTLTGIWKAETPPPPNQRNFLWYNTLSSHIYEWINGGWMRKYSPSASSGAEWIWKGTEADLANFEGGSAGTVGDFTGPLWEIDHEIDGRTMIGVGDIPGSSPLISVGQGDTGGTADHTITQAQLPAYDLIAHIKAAQANGLDTDTMEVLCNPISSFNAYDLHVPLGGGGESFSMVTPYLGRYLIKRTARIWVSSPY